MWTKLRVRQWLEDWLEREGEDLWSSSEARAELAEDLAERYQWRLGLKWVVEGGIEMVEPQARAVYAVYRRDYEAWSSPRREDADRVAQAFNELDATISASGCDSPHSAPQGAANGRERT